MKVTLNWGNLNTLSFSSIAVLLEGPDGTNLDIQSFGCGGLTGSASFDLTDSATSLFPHSQCGTLAASYRPTYYFVTPVDDFPTPGPGSSGYKTSGDGSNPCSGTPCTTGTGTFANTFGALPVSSLNGTWRLYAVDQSNFSANTTLSWTITFVVTGSAAPTSTTLNGGSPNPSFTSGTGSSVTWTAHVTSSGNNVTEGSVTVHDNTTNSNLGSGNLNSNGIATISGVVSTESDHDLIANYNGTANFAPSSSNHVSQTAINHATGPTSNPDGSVSFCNGAVAINTSGKSTPYPSQIILGGTEPTLSGVIQKVTVTINGLETQDPQTLIFGLQAPGAGSTFEFLGWADGSLPSTIGAGIQIALSDTGSATIPGTSRANCPATSPCLPTDRFNEVGPTSNDSFPSPAPSQNHKAAPTGSSTFNSEFGGLGVNGSWNFYLLNNSVQAPPTGQAASWCINFTMQANAHPTTTLLTASPNPVSSSSPITLTATVSSDTTVNAGSVTFISDGTNLGSANVINGVARLSPTIGEGTHHLGASYSGTTAGTVFGVSNGATNIRSNNPITESGSQPYSFCDAGAMHIPAGSNDSGPAGPYPSNITVAGLPGTVKALTVSLKSFSTNDQNDFLGLLVGPGGNNLDFFSLSGATSCGGPCHNTFGPADLTFDDTATSDLVNRDASASGSYKPTSLNSGASAVAYPQCPPNATDCASPPVGPPLPSDPFTPTNKAEPAGTAILGNANAAGVFGGTTASTYNGNGIWSLYLNDGPVGAGRFSTIGSWCVNFTQNLPDISLSTLSNSPSTLKRSSTATINATVHNAGPGPTGGTLTFTDTLPTGLTLNGSQTSGNWSCSGTTTVTCTSSTAIAQNTDDSFSFTVNVASTTADTISNSASVAGGGDNTPGNNSANDNNIPVTGTILHINKTHTDPFTQNQTGATYNITVSNLGADGTNTPGHVGATVGIVQVTDSMPSGFMVTNVAGTGWTCDPAPAVSCTLNSSLAVGSTTNAIVVMLNVANNVEGPVINTANLIATTDQIGTADLTCANNVSCHNDSTNITQVPTQIGVSAGSGQSATINTAFANALAAIVKDAGNNPVSGVSVTFTAPGTSPSGAFSGSCSGGSCTVTTNSSGIATASTFTANGTVGSYNVVGSAAGVSLPAAFGLTNTDTPATVTSVSSTTANGTYGVGAAPILITVGFSKAVNVTGAPILGLNSGGTASYASGSGTTALTFSYTIGAGQNANPLDEASTGALTLNGGTIQNPSGQAATLTLPAPGGANSLGANKSIVIDTTPAIVTGVTTTTANGTYGVGTSITIVVSFNKAVTVSGGTPIMPLNSSGNSFYASNASPSSLNFSYTVLAGQNSAHLDYTSPSALTLPPGVTIQGPGGTNANVTLPAPGSPGSLSANSTLVIDTTQPTVVGVSSTNANGTYTLGAPPILITVIFSKPVNVTGTPMLALNSGGTAGFASGTGTNTLTFSYTIAAGQNANPLDAASSAALTLNGGTIKDAAGNPATLTLPAPGTAGSLGVNKDIVIVSGGSLGGSFGLKSGPINARQWIINVGNGSSFAVATPQVTGLTLTQVFGAACTPVIAALPVAASPDPIPSHSTGQAIVTIDFSSCTGRPFFKAVATVSAQGGTITGTITSLNQAP